MGASYSYANWTDLPIEILENEILTKLPDVLDFIRSGAVSRSWRSATVESKNTNNSFSFLPWLMLSESEEESNKEEVRKFVSLSSKKTIFSSKKTIELYLPEVKGRRCWGSTFGWILTIGVDLNIHLLNPLTRLQISLPPQPTFKNQFQNQGARRNDGELVTHFLRRIYIEKFALSTHPNANHPTVVMIVCGPDRKLSIARPGDTAWTDVESTRIWFDDVIFFNNLFYAIKHGGTVVVISDITTTSVPVATDFILSPFPMTHSIKYYLVEMSGHLHMVVRRFKVVRRDTTTASISTIQFRVYQLDFPLKQWIELQHLGDYTLFLGNNPSFAIKHPDLPSNCIYFTDDHSQYHKRYATSDMGVFDFGKKKVVDPIYSGDCLCSRFCATPLFFIPNLR